MEKHSYHPNYIATGFLILLPKMCHLTLTWNAYSFKWDPSGKFMHRRMHAYPFTANLSSYQLNRLTKELRWEFVYYFAKWISLCPLQMTVCCDALPWQYCAVFYLICGITINDLTIITCSKMEAKNNKHR